MFLSPCRQAPSIKMSAPCRPTLALLVCFIVFLLILSWHPWTHACRVGEAVKPGPAGIFTKHLKCNFCATWLSSPAALRAHTKRLHSCPTEVAGSPPMSEEGVGLTPACVNTVDDHSVMHSQHDPELSHVQTSSLVSDSDVESENPGGSFSDGSSECSSNIEDTCVRTCKVPFRVDKMMDTSWVAVSANVTSLRRQYDEVLRLPWDLICLQEVRLTSAGQYDMRQRLEGDDCSVVFGQPQDSLSNPWHCKQGGVAIAARNGLRLQAVQPVNDVERALLATKRYVHAAVPIGNGKQVLHVISLYGFSGASSCSARMSLNESLLSQVFQVLAVLGNVPVLLAGDFNVNLDSSAVIQTAKWIDACKTCASAQGAQPDPTCFVRNTSTGTRIDAFLANASSRCLLGEAGVLLDSTLPTHCPIALELKLGSCMKHVVVVKRPKRIPLAFVDPDADAEEQTADRCARSVLQSSSRKWSSVCDAMNVELMWSAWCTDAESYLCARAETAGLAVDRKRVLGRGIVRFIKRQVGMPIDADACARSAKSSKLGKLRRRIVDLLRQVLASAGLGLDTFLSF